MPSGTPAHARRSRLAASPGAEDAVEGTARDAGQPVDPGLDQSGLGGRGRPTSSRLPSTARWAAAHDVSISLAGNYHAPDAGSWTRSVIPFTIGALTVMATDCNEQFVISSLQSAQIA